MKQFMDKDFLLINRDGAGRCIMILQRKCRYLDYHCHINPQEIC
ncbi:MAG: hypothetical protein ACLTBV_16030 [Enterocloster bolteae]